MQVNAIGLRAPKPAKPQKLSRERSVTRCLNTLRRACRSERTRASFSHPANLADVSERCRTVAARTLAESDRLTMGCGGVLNSCRQGTTEKNSRLAPRAGFEPATIRLTVECSTAELPRNRRNPMGRDGLRITKPQSLAKREIGRSHATSTGDANSLCGKDLLPF